MKWTFFLLLACGLCSATMTRVNLTDTPDGEGAVCNDGSTGIYYYKAGKGVNSTKWIMHLMAGGFCMTAEECYYRTQTMVGTSTLYPDELDLDWDAPVSDDETINPHFHDWNHVYFVYCDGASFSGDRDEPEDVNGTKIYYRGHRILVASIKDLLKTKGLDNATDVLLVGDSAGGVATYLHADEVKSMLPENVRFKASAFSGIFLDRPNAEGTIFWRDLFKHMYEMQNCTNNLNAKCESVFTGDDAYKCMLAQYTLDYIKTPFFTINSAYDLVSLRCIVMGEPLISTSLSGVGNCSSLPGWGECSNLTCTNEQWKKLEEYADAFRGIVHNSPKLNTDGNGLFEYSCISHALEPYDPYWGRYAVNGVILRDALVKWFFSDNEPSSKHFYEDCDNTQTHACNPTCYDPASSYSSQSSFQSSSLSSSQSSSHIPRHSSSESAATIIYPMMAIVAATFLALLF